MQKRKEEKEKLNGQQVLVFDDAMSGETESTPLVSIIIPVYNKEKFLRKTLDSALNQTYSNIEVIAVNDGSTDGSSAVLDEYSKEDARVKVVNTVNRGAGAARNTSLAVAKGEFIKFLDGDDALKPECVEVLMKYQQEYNADMVKCALESNVENTVARLKDKWVLKPVFVKKKDFVSAIYPMLFTSIQMNSVCTLLIRKSLTDNSVFRTDMTTAEDLMYVIDMLTDAESMVLIPDVLYEYNQKQIGSITGTNSAKTVIKKFKANKIVSKYLLAHLKEWGIDTPMYRSVARKRAYNTIIWKLENLSYTKQVKKEQSESKPPVDTWDKPVAPTWIEQRLVDAMNGVELSGKKVMPENIPAWKTIRKLSNFYELRYLKMPVYNAIKRALDFIIALVALIILAIPMGIVALILLLTDGAPVIYRQTRLGRYGKPFTLYKFRSMPNNAEAKTGAVWASGDDDRATGIGRILRLTKIDELPQLVNILKGEMSFVGPRPERPEFYNKFINKDGVKYFDNRLLVQPGLTGLAQITKGTNVTPAEKLELDLEYIKKRSILFDAKMFIGTIIAVPEGKAK